MANRSGVVNRARPLPMRGSCPRRHYAAGVQRGDRSHHRFDRSGRSRNPTRGNVGFTRGLSSAGARSTSEFVSRPPKSSAWPSWIFVGLLMRRGRVTRRGNMGNPSHVEWEARRCGLCIRAAAPRAPRKGRSRGSPRLPLHETKLFRWEGS